jgi:hypothetical protein
VSGQASIAVRDVHPDGAVVDVGAGTVEVEVAAEVEVADATLLTVVFGAVSCPVCVPHATRPRDATAKAAAAFADRRRADTSRTLPASCSSARASWTASAVRGIMFDVT